MAVPYTFGSATSAIPLSQLDSNFATAITLGSTALTLGTTTTTVAGLTLTSPVISTISNTGTLTLPTSTDTLVGRATTDTLTNKSISGSSNTLTNIPNSALTNTTVTIGSTSIALGGTATTVAGLTLTSPTMTTPILGTPTSGTLTNCTGLPISTGLSGLTTNGVAYATSTSALATGSALTFDGTNFGVGTSSPSSYGKLAVVGSSTGELLQGNFVNSNSGSNTTKTVSINLWLTDTITTPKRVGSILGYPDGSNVITGGMTFNVRTSDSGVAEVMRLTSAGNLGIGTSSPDVFGRGYSGTILGISSSGQSAIELNSATGNTAYLDMGVNGTRYLTINTTSSLSIIQTVGAYPLTFGTNVTEQMRLDTSGNLGLGVTPSAWSGFRALQIGGTTSIWSSTSGNGSSFYSNNIYYNGSSRIYTTTGYATEYIQDSSVGSHIWFTAPSGTVGGTVTTIERMRIDNSGNLLVGTTSQLGSSKISFQSGSDCISAWSTGNGTAINAQIRTTSSQFAAWNYGSGNTTIGSISTVAGTSVLYNTTSDQRLKTNIVDAPDGNIDSIKVRSFDWKVDGSHQTYGMIAQELVEVAPYAVHQPANPEEMMAVDYSKLVPMMIKEIQSLKQRIATLENK